MLGRDDFVRIGSNLSRPECVVTHVSGHVFCADWSERGGVAVIAPDGGVQHVAARNWPTAEWGEPMRPNGIALEPGGSFLVAHLGATRGGLFRLWPDGGVETLLTEVGGEVLPPLNFVLRETSGRVWLSVSTRLRPRHLDYRPDARTGFLVRVDDRGAAMAADGLGYTNEFVLSDDGGTLFLNETFNRRLSTFTVGADGELRDHAVLMHLGTGTYPDGLTLDQAGMLWMTSIVSNRILRIDPAARAATTVFEDFAPQHLAWVEDAFLAGTMGREHMDRPGASPFGSISSLAFGGSDLRTAYLGNLLADCIWQVRVPAPGRRPQHFDFDIAPLLAALR